MFTTNRGPGTGLADVTTDDLEQRLLRLEAHLSKARSAQIEILRELERRQVTTLDGTHSLKEWIAGRLDTKPSTASDLAVLAKSEHQPIHDKLAAGEFTLDRAAETTRLANTGADAATIERSLLINVSQITQLAARQRRMTSLDETEAFEARRVWMQPNLDNTLVQGTFALPGAAAEEFMQALDDRADQIIDRQDEHRPRAEQRRADALVSLALDQIAPVNHEGLAPRRLKTHIFINGEGADVSDGATGCTTASGIKIGPNTLAEILCIGETQTTVVQDGRLRAVRTDGDRIPHRIRDYIYHRDAGACTADGCTSRYRLEPHHIRQRSHGGDHDPNNLGLFCWFHHHVVIHQHGYRIDPHSPPQRRRFIRPGGEDRGPPG